MEEVSVSGEFAGIFHCGLNRVIILLSLQSQDKNILVNFFLSEVKTGKLILLATKPELVFIIYITFFGTVEDMDC